jgi:hypothetical protein
MVDKLFSIRDLFLVQQTYSSIRLFISFYRVCDPFFGLGNIGLGLGCIVGGGPMHQESDPRTLNPKYYNQRSVFGN